MTRDLPPEPEEDEERPEPGPGHVRTTGTGTLVVFGLIGLVLGWLVRPISVRLNGSAPTVGWLPVLALLLGAVILAAVAWSTYRDLHPKKPGRPPRVLEPHQAVNRLVLAKSCALAGAMVGGGYFGYALSWWRVSEASLAEQRMVQSVLAGLSGVLIVAAALWLERACRVRGEGDADLR